MAAPLLLRSLALAPLLVLLVLVLRQ
eukprot:COSAG06_NODE_52940_length_303_cov_0.455882_2_plen_25_part_01